MLVILAGLPGTGKSTLARAAAARVGAAVIDKDPIRAALFAPEEVEYTADQDDFVMELMLETARYLLSKQPGRIVFIDGRTFSRAYQRRRAIDFAKTIGESWRIVECVCSQETAQARLARDRDAGQHPAANRSFDLYEQVRAHFEPIAEPALVLDTDSPLEDCLAQMVPWVSGVKSV